MADVHNTEQRTRNMRSVKSKNTAPELLVRRVLHAAGFRFRLHKKDLPGRPDIVLPRFKAVIFVDGCFWHGHRCGLFKAPQTRTEFWLDKIAGNRRRDVAKDSALHALGWRVLHVWECSLRGSDRLDVTDLASALTHWLTSGRMDGAITGRRCAF